MAGERMDITTTTATSGLSRRTVVRAAAWSAPAVSIVVAAPAFACSVTAPDITDVTAAYDPDAPELLTVAGDVACAGTYTLTITIPAGKVDSVEAPAPATVSPTGGGGFLVVLPATGSQFSVTLTLGSRAASPWRGYRGSEMVVTAVATSSGGSTPPASAMVAAAPLSRLSSDAAGTVTGAVASVLGLGATDVGLVADDRSAVGRLRIAVRLPTDGPVGGLTAPTLVGGSLDPAWQQDPGDFHEPNAWVFRFVTTQDAHTARTGSPTDRGPSGFDFAASLDVAGSGIVPGAPARFYFSSDDDKVVRVTMATPLPAA